MTATATPAKRGPGRPRKATTPPAPVGNGHQPVGAEIPAELRFTSAPVEVEMEPLFSIDGTVYHVPKNPPVNEALGLLNKLRQGVPEMVAVADLFVAIVGEDAFEALTECKGLTGDNLNALMNMIRDKTMGQLDQIKGE